MCVIKLWLPCWGILCFLSSGSIDCLLVKNNVNVSPPPVCCLTAHSCWCPARSASDPVQTGRHPGCCPWPLSAAGWPPPHAPTPPPASHLGCAAAPGRAKPPGLSSGRLKGEIMRWLRPSSWVSYCCFLKKRRYKTGGCIMHKTARLTTTDDCGGQTGAKHSHELLSSLPSPVSSLMDDSLS